MLVPTAPVALNRVPLSLKPREVVLDTALAGAPNVAKYASTAASVGALPPIVGL
jgi:hypothetical protein